MSGHPGVDYFVMVGEACAGVRDDPDDARADAQRLGGRVEVHVHSLEGAQWHGGAECARRYELAGGALIEPIHQA